jgi:sugar phosphate isomerase/epimerase
MANDVTFSVFTKPWKTSIESLGRMLQGLGYTAIELPVRPGYPVTPENVAGALPAAARTLARYGVSIASIAGPTDEATIAACAEAGVPIIRVMVPIGPEGYWATIEQTRREYDALLLQLERYGVCIGVQNHCDRFVANAMGLQQLLAPYPRACIAAVWDAAHNALCGEEPELALEIIWPHLCMVNLKNAFPQRTNGPEAEHAQWRYHWTTGRHGLASWPRVAAELRRRAYRGVICLTAEYSDAADEAVLARLVAEDLAYARALFPV